MQSVFYVITNFIEKTMEEKGLNFFIVSDGKYLAMDSALETRFKFDLTFSDNDFTCHILTKAPEDELKLKHSVNIAWTNGAELRNFMEYVRKMSLISCDSLQNASKKDHLAVAV